jgi:hypothetical protein
MKLLQVVHAIYALILFLNLQIFARLKILSTRKLFMDAQMQRSIETSKSEPVNGSVASADFELWAKAVRQQMLDCLRKKTGVSDSSGAATPPEYSGHRSVEGNDKP